jgi:acyl-CoA synthetase (AMP-forming)/AMP-acid ligase II
MGAAPPHTLVAWMAAIAAGQPHRPALIQDGEVWTWRRFWTRSGEIAQALRAMDGFAPGRTVALVGANEAEYIAAYFGVLSAGAVVAPLNAMLQGEELVRHAEFVDVFGTIVGDVDEATAEALAAVAPTWSLGALQAARAGHLPRLGPASPACVLLTSGSTGRPKGVVHTQGTLLHAAVQIASAFPFASDERSVAFLPFFASIPEQVLPTLVAGGRLEIVRQFDEETVCRACAEATSFDAVPTIMARLLDHAGADLMRNLRWVMFASEPMPATLLERWWDALPGVETHQLYGMTEMLTITHAPHRVLTAHPASVGRAFVTSSVGVIAPDGGAAAPGVAGEVICRSPARMKGYYNDPAATEAALDPGGALRTGDLGYLDEDGRLHLTGRLKDIIISGGLNIAPAEIELVACRHPRIAAAAVVGVPHPRWGETPVVVAVPAAGNSVTAADVLDFCRQELSSFKRPTAAGLIDALPLTGIGKSAKSEIRQRVLKGEIELVRAG